MKRFLCGLACLSLGLPLMAGCVVENRGKAEKPSSYTKNLPKSGPVGAGGQAQGEPAVAPPMSPEPKK
jgi:hypothetical protein